MTDKATLMKRINMLSFAVDEAVLFLDTHPEDREALRYYHEMNAQRQKAVAEYTAEYGPLTAPGLAKIRQAPPESVGRGLPLCGSLQVRVIKRRPCKKAPGGALAFRTCAGIRRKGQRRTLLYPP